MIIIILIIAFYSRWTPAELVRRKQPWKRNSGSALGVQFSINLRPLPNMVLVLVLLYSTGHQRDFA